MEIKRPTVKCTLIGAELTRDVAIATMDPYGACNYDGKQYKSSVHENGGKMPQWNYTFDLEPRDINDDIELIVMDSNTGSDTAIGTCKVKISQICQGNGIDEYFTLLFGGASAGKIHIKT